MIEAAVDNVVVDVLACEDTRLRSGGRH